MKRKILPMLALFASLALTSCGGGNGGAKSSSTRHRHSAAPDATWKNDETTHWHDCIENDGGKADSASHSFVEKTDDPAAKAPSCTETGTKVEVCSVCGYRKETTLEKTAHNYVEKTDDPAAKAPSCSETGLKVEICSVCQDRKETTLEKTAHTLGEPFDVVPATCAAAGSQKRQCSACQEIVTETLAKLEHTWDDGVASGNCGEAGKITYTCSACGETKEETSGYIQHAWTVTGSVAAGDGGLAYELLHCSKCNKDGLLVHVKNADGTNNMTVTGNPKTAPTGCVKLGAAGDYILGAIKLDAAKTGKLFFRGSMDYWYTSSNRNQEKGIYDGKGSTSKDNGVANFKMEVGQSAEALTEVALTADKNLLYKDFLPEEVGFSGVDGTDWSQIGDVEIGNVSLAAGLNYLKFSRVDSYNCAIYGFVVAFDA